MTNEEYDQGFVHLKRIFSDRFHEYVDDDNNYHFVYDAKSADLGTISALHQKVTELVDFLSIVIGRGVSICENPASLSTFDIQFNALMIETPQAVERLARVPDDYFQHLAREDFYGAIHKALNSWTLDADLTWKKSERENKAGFLTERGVRSPPAAIRAIEEQLSIPRDRIEAISGRRIFIPLDSLDNTVLQAMYSKEMSGELARALRSPGWGPQPW